MQRTEDRDCLPCGRGEFGVDVDDFERDLGDEDHVDVSVQAAVEAEVAQVGGHAVLVARVVAEDRDWDALILCCFGVVSGWKEICDIEDELVVASGMFACEFFTDVDGCGLACAFEVQ